VRLPEFTHATAFRWTITVAGVFILWTLLLFGFVYWQTAAYLTSTIDVLLTGELRLISIESPNQRRKEIEDRLRHDPRRFRIAGLFEADGRRISGNLESLPPGLTPDQPANATVTRLSDDGGRESQKVRLAALWLADGEVLAIGRNIEELAEIAEIVGWALTLGLLPAFGVAVAIGMVLSWRARERVSEVNKRIQRIIAGDLRERLSSRDRDDPFDQLAISVNRMLGKIEALIQEISGVGDDIAHDLRTPLTRVRIRLERGRARARTLEELQTVADQAIAGLDQSLAIITALLRIAEIEHSRRLAGFDQVQLAAVVREVGDVYEPIAEDKAVVFQVDASNDATVHGDRDLIFEAVANLVDNAVKFTPAGGRVRVALVRNEGETVIHVEDSGSGIPDGELEAVTKRFYRSDKSRSSEGLGLGLSLVAAIVNLHGFRFRISGGPGCTAEIICSPTH
jgi:signal transduction histidine kinase